LLRVNLANTSSKSRQGSQDFKESLIKVARSTSILFSDNTLDEVLDDIFYVLTSVLEQQWVAIAEVTGDELKFVRITKKPLENRVLNLSDKGITIRAVKTGLPQLVPDTRQDPDYTEFDCDDSFLSEVDFPVKIDNQVKYVINVESTELDGFSNEELALIELVVIQMEAAVKNVLNKQRLAEYAMQLQTVSKAMADMDLCDSE